MTDISNELVDIMSNNDCSSVYALFMLSQKEEEESVCTIQSESSE